MSTRALEFQWGRRRNFSLASGGRILLPEPFLPGAEAVAVERAVNRQDAVEMIHLVLDEFGESA